MLEGDALAVDRANITSLPPFFISEEESLSLCEAEDSAAQLELFAATSAGIFPLVFSKPSFPVFFLVFLAPSFGATLGAISLGSIVENSTDFDDDLPPLESSSRSSSGLFRV